MYGNSGLRNLDFLLQTMGRNMSEGGGSISEAAEDNGNGRRRQKTTGDAGVRRMTAEDDGSGGSVRMLLEDIGRWQFDVLQSRFRRAGGGHAYHRSKALLTCSNPLLLFFPCSFWNPHPFQTKSITNFLKSDFFPHVIIWLSHSQTG